MTFGNHNIDNWRYRRDRCQRDLREPGSVCRRDGKEAGGAYMWESQAVAEAFYSGPWAEGIRARYGCTPRISYFETVALADQASGKAGALD